MTNYDLNLVSVMQCPQSFNYTNNFLMNKSQIDQLNDDEDKSKELGKLLGWEALRHEKERHHLEGWCVGTNMCDSISASVCSSANAGVCWCTCV